MKKTPNDGNCPRCGGECEMKDELRIGNECWREDSPGAPSREEADTIKVEFLYDCPDCTYVYP